MQSELFDQSNMEIADQQQRFALQNSQMLRVSLGPDVLATKGSMVAFQGSIEFHHEKSGSMGKLLKKMVTSRGQPPDAGHRSGRGVLRQPRRASST